MSTVFLSDEDIVTLTGKCWKSKQIEALRKMHLAFQVNALGKPVVTVAAVEGRKNEAPIKKQWQPPE